MGRVAGLDFGSVRIGVAVSDEGKILARPLGVVQSRPDCFLALDKLLKAEGVIDLIVVGLPLKMNGQDSPTTTLARTFAKALEEKLSLPVVLWDERLTSALVERAMIETGAKRKKRAEFSDTLSAVVILQSYLDKTG